jgi:hypothetical protein
MKNTFILSIILTSFAFAGSPEKPCIVPDSGKSSDAVVTRQSINDILNKTVRSNQDFIGPVKRVTITVDAGRSQIEASLFDYRRDKGGETFTYGQINMKAGLTHNIDLQAVLDLRSETADSSTTFGDLTLRLKYNLWGNDGGDTALAIMPDVIAPTRGDEWQGGVIIPWATNLTDDVSLGLMGQFDFVHDGNDHETEFLFTAVLGYPIYRNLGGYSEYLGIIAEDRYESDYSGGLTYEINANLVLDAGIQVGLNRDSGDFGLFTGFTKQY